MGIYLFRAYVITTLTSPVTANTITAMIVPVAALALREAVDTSNHQHRPQTLLLIGSGRLHWGSGMSSLGCGSRLVGRRRRELLCRSYEVNNS